MVPSIICAPPDAPQIFKPTPVPPKPRRLDWQDELLLEHLREAETCKTWSLLNVVADEQCPRDRTDGRLVRLRLLERLKRLRRLGLVFAVGRNRLSSSKPDPAARRPAVKRWRRRPTVVGLRPGGAVSADTGSGPQQTGKQPQQVHSEVLPTDHGGQQTPPTGPETESVPSPETVSEAARQLATMPRQTRCWSGWIGDVRSYRDMPILLPNGRRAWVFGAQRNKVVVTYDKGRLLGTLTPQQRWFVLPASKVQIVKNEHAVILGKRKAGTKEVVSPRKQEAARANGRLPPGPARRRGRPRRHQTSCLPVSL